MANSWIFRLNKKTSSWPSRYKDFMKGKISSETWQHACRGCRAGDYAYVISTKQRNEEPRVLAYGIISKVAGTDVTIVFEKIFPNDSLTVKKLIDKFPRQTWDPQGCSGIKNASDADGLHDECDKIPNPIILRTPSGGPSIYSTPSYFSPSPSLGFPKGWTVLDHHPLNLILYGPPGTGKTYNTVNEALSAIEGEIVENLQKEDRDDLLRRFNEYKDKGQIVFTTFHQSLGYEEFIEGIKPIPDSSPIGAEHTNKNSSGSNQFGEGTTTISNLVRMKYEVKPGLFKELCEKAIESSQVPFVLIIDEINRGNVSQIFGELITLIEESKRTTKWTSGTYVDNPEKIEVKLPYSHEQFGVPGNLYIIGTMNTADRSVEALDTALRRRFEFKEMMPKPELLEDKICGHELKDILTTINNRIRALKDREHQIGHSYFMNCKTEDDLKNVFKNNIVPLLQEYFYGNYAYIGLVLGEEFVKEDEDVSKIVFADFRATDVPEKETVYRLLTEKEWEDLDLPKAIASLMSKKDGTKKDETVAGEPGKTDKNSEEVG